MTADRDALLDLLGIVERATGAGLLSGELRAAADRARRHVDRTPDTESGEAFAAVREDGREQGVRPFRDLFAGGPDTSCRTTWRPEGGHIGTALPHTVECVEVPLDDLRAAFVEAGDPE